MNNLKPLNCLQCGCVTAHEYAGKRQEPWKDFTDERAPKGALFWQHLWKCQKCHEIRVYGSESIAEATNDPSVSDTVRFCSPDGK